MNTAKDILITAEAVSEIIDIFTKYKLPVKERVAICEFVKYACFKEMEGINKELFEK